jgi:hypothetical protein
MSICIGRFGCMSVPCWLLLHLHDDENAYAVVVSFLFLFST